MSTWLSGIIGQGIAANLGATGCYSAGQQAAQQQVTAALTPQQLYNQYASVLFGTPQGAYLPNFAGTQAQTTTTANKQLGFSL